jgi:hypothetical protein
MSRRRGFFRSSAESEAFAHRYMMADVSVV